MIKKIVMLVVVSFITFTAYADENANPVADVNVDHVTLVKQDMRNQHFFVDGSQEIMVFHNDTNKTMKFSITWAETVTGSFISEGSIKVICRKDDKRAPDIVTVKPGHTRYECYTKDSVAFYYSNKKGFATGTYDIILTSGSWI